jgi:hypothetical protein
VCVVEKFVAVAVEEYKMKKRILLILVLGVSFAPAVFAANAFSGLREYEVESSHTGQLELSRTNPASSHCSGSDKFNTASNSAQQGSNHKNSSAVAAH